MTRTWIDRRLSIALLLVLVFKPVHSQLSPQVSVVRDEAESAAKSEQPLYASPTILDRVGRIVVPVMVNDQGPFRFVLDTGANRSVLAEHMPAKLGLTLSDETMSVELSGVTGQAIVRTVAVKHLRAGALLLEDLNLPVLGATMAGIDGVLGVEGFDGKRLTVDFVNDRVTIEHSRNGRVPADFMTLPVRFQHGRLLVVDAIVGRVRCKAVIDTGAEGSLGNEPLQRTLRRKQTNDRVVESAKVEGVTAEVQTGELMYSPLIRFSGAEIIGVKIAYGNFNVFKLWDLERQPALLVGMDILGTVDTLIIDYRRRELHIKPRSNVLHPSMK